MTEIDKWSMFMWQVAKRSATYQGEVSLVFFLKNEPAKMYIISHGEIQILQIVGFLFDIPNVSSAD